MRILIIGGTRNLGPSLINKFLERGDSVAVFNRGVTPSALPPQVEQLRGDRTIPKQLSAAVRGRDFDAVRDMLADEVRLATANRYISLAEEVTERPFEATELTARDRVAALFDR